MSKEEQKEIERLKGIIKNFCKEQGWAHSMWKDQPHIKPLFDECENNNE